MKSAVARLIVVTSMGLIAACSGEPQLVSTIGDAGDVGTTDDTVEDTSQPDGDSGPADECIQTTPQQAADFAADYATAVCERAFECANNPEVAVNLAFGGWETVSDCVTMAQAGLTTPGQARQAASENTLALNSCNSQPCLDSIPNLDCLAVHRALSNNPVERPTSECKNAYAGMLEQGEPCTTAAQCAGSSVCARDDSSTSCTGTCQDAGQATAQCGDIVCRYDQYCDTENDICVSKKQNGESCTNNFECQVDARCEQGSCQQATSGLDVGANCNFSTELCRAGIGCLDGTCEELKAPGEECPLYGCRGDNTCSTDTETCVPFKEAGESCSNPQDCKSLNCAGGTCAPYDSLCP
jgi:hypothetical protein